MSIEVFQNTIDSYTDFHTQHIFTKCLGIRGFPGSGKTWTMEYMILYGISKGLFYLTTVMMSKRAIQFSGKHWYYLFFSTERYLPPHRMAEISLTMIMRNPIKYSILLILYILYCDEVGQDLAELLSSINIILRIIKKTSIYFGRILYYMYN